jgi:5'-methylthioadenosine phosphorylase
MAEIAIIGGSGFYQPGIFTEPQEIEVNTPYGTVQPLLGKAGGVEVAFIPRHGKEHSLLPHQLNYRANIWALKELGVKRIIATSAVGSLNRSYRPGTMAIIDQFLDFTKQRPFTFFDQGDAFRAHVDMTGPYCPELRRMIIKAASMIKVPVQPTGCYVCAEGPRYETAAEIKMYQKLGGDVVGMTGVPEVVLARELGVCYAGISTITNWAAGLNKKPLTHQEVVAVMKENQAKLRELILRSLTMIGQSSVNCYCGQNVAGES